MPKTPIANAIVELNHKKKSFPLDMIGTMLKMEDFFLFSLGFSCGILAYLQCSVCIPARMKENTGKHGRACYIWHYYEDFLDYGNKDVILLNRLVSTGHVLLTD